MKSLMCLLLLFASLAIGAGVGVACTCVPPPSPSEELEHAAAVFSGKVVQIKRHKPTEDIFGGVEVVFRVDKAWKGVGRRTVSVFTSSQTAACGYGFSKGHTYLVYASGNSRGRLSTSICSRTKRLKDAREDLDELGAGKKIAKDRVTEPLSKMVTRNPDSAVLSHESN
jgi:tissue inhibitor of metalloproteinase